MQTHTVYEVKPGDNLKNIAKRHKTSWQAIYNANRIGQRRADGTMGWLITADALFVGRKLIIPKS